MAVLCCLLLADYGFILKNEGNTFYNLWDFSKGVLVFEKSFFFEIR